MNGQEYRYFHDIFCKLDRPNKEKRMPEEKDRSEHMKDMKLLEP